MIEILLADITTLGVDAIVNAANERLAEGSNRSIAFPAISWAFT